MQTIIEDQRLIPILEKVTARIPLSVEDGLTMSTTADILALGYIANIVRERMYGNITYFSILDSGGETAEPDPQTTTFAIDPHASGFHDMKQIAMARLLDNVRHVQLRWSGPAPGIAQIAQRFGADSLELTIDIAHHDSMRTALTRLIREAGREPFERDSRKRAGNRPEQILKVLT